MMMLVLHVADTFVSFLVSLKIGRKIRSFIATYRFYYYYFFYMAIYGIAAFYDIDLISLQHKTRILLIFMLSYIKHKQASNLQRQLPIGRGLRYRCPDRNSFSTRLMLFRLSSSLYAHCCFSRFCCLSIPHDTVAAA